MNVYGVLSEYFTVLWGYRLNGILTDFHKYTIDTKFAVCATGTKRHKLPQNTLLSSFALHIKIYWWQLFRDNDRSRQCLIEQTASRTRL